jgi:hypothetical protein
VERFQIRARGSRGWSPDAHPVVVTTGTIAEADMDLGFHDINVGRRVDETGVPRRKLERCYPVAWDGHRKNRRTGDDGDRV